MTCACRVCGADTSRKPWVLLNRIAYGTGSCRGCTEFRNDDGECVWEVSDDLDIEEEVVSGPVVCFPACLQVFLEWKMVEADIAMGHTS